MRVGREEMLKGGEFREIKIPAIERLREGGEILRVGEQRWEGLFMLLKSRAKYKGVNYEVQGGCGVSLPLSYSIQVITKRR